MKKRVLLGAALFLLLGVLIFLGVSKRESGYLENDRGVRPMAVPAAERTGFAAGDESVQHVDQAPGNGKKVALPFDPGKVPVPALPPLAGPLAGSDEERRALALKMATTLIGPLMDTMLIQGRQKEEVLLALADHQLELEAGLVAFHRGAQPPSLDDLKRSDEARERKIREILGTEKATELTQRMNTRVERNLVSAVSEHLNSIGQPMAPEQQAQFLDELVPAYQGQKTDAQDMNREAVVGRRMAALESLLTSGKTPLSLEQKKAIAGFIQTQKEAAKSGRP
jgi:hypothetical protein